MSKKADVWVPHELTEKNILDRVMILAEKRPELANRKGVVFHHDNAKPHTALVTKKKLKCFGWEVMQHPPYSPDLAPSDYHLFRSLQNNLDGQRFNSVDDIQTYLEDFFAQKSRDFYKRGIMSLLERWQKVVDQDGQYILD
ncbi:Histone-lysine N-methyltransferase SETMAR [Ooceraea biroi]|uniref:Histone-lysine N-methyltransferase SETMAR n=1 Tax=Ooceraea biroi TaxID=2015173 RepID=A0A026WMV1_OOCBI|nr:Histone-lysine N-methyltransferase SETMAR [Ooceraea biroi]